MVELRKQGEFLQADFFDNTGGMNLTDSPFRVLDSQSTGGQNFEYALTGGFRKIKGKTLINSSADTRTRSVGMGLHTASSGTKTVIRAADRKLQSVNISTPTFTALTEDTVTAGSDFLAADNTIPVVWSQFNTSNASVLWAAGGGMSTLYGAYSSTKASAVGVQELAGSISLSATGADGAFASTGYYRYGVALRKASTLSTGNVTLFKEVNVTATTQHVTITLSSITVFDTTKYDQIWIYRSAVSATALGNVAFTTGDLIAKVASSTTSTNDLGTYIETVINVPQANATADYSILPSGTYKSVTTWKRRLVTASGATLYISDINRPEAFPTENYITVPSGGAITGLAVISLTTPTSATVDELLVIFQERDLWVVTGDSATSSTSPWVLKYIDSVGCIGQQLVVAANGYLFWIDYRGVYLWDGSGKPIYCSRTLENLFYPTSTSDSIDKSALSTAWGTFCRFNNQVVWVLTTDTSGGNKFMIKLDVRLTLPAITNVLGGRILESVLITDLLATALYAGAAMAPSTEELFLAGDASGYIYKMFDALTDNGSGVDFRYETAFHTMGTPGTTKRFRKVIAWVEDSTDADLTLEYWTNFISGDDEKSTQVAPISNQVREPLYDVAYWDAAYYDVAIRGFNPVVFNLASAKNAIEGDCIKLRFKQASTNAPVTVAGYSILFNEVGLRK